MAWHRVCSVGPSPLHSPTPGVLRLFTHYRRVCFMKVVSNSPHKRIRATHAQTSSVSSPHSSSFFHILVPLLLTERKAVPRTSFSFFFRVIWQNAKCPLLPCTALAVAFVIVLLSVAAFSAQLFTGLPSSSPEASPEAHPWATLCVIVDWSILVSLISLINLGFRLSK